MDHVRWDQDSLSYRSLLPCCRCDNADRPWDRIAGKAYCPECQELLILGESPPLVERTERRPCAICHKIGAVGFLTFPLPGTRPLAMDFCPEHLRALLGRRLGPFAYHQLRRQLDALGLTADDFFLLHNAFYDPSGHALQPALDE
jgi:hypothetical protein